MARGRASVLVGIVGLAACGSGPATTMTGATSSASFGGSGAATTMPSGTTGASTSEGGGPLDEERADSCPLGPCDYDHDIGLANYECDLVVQSCPRGTKCMPLADDGGDAWTTTRCTPLAPDPVPIGGACVADGSGVSGIDDCDVGLMCWDVDETNVGHCEDFCTGSLHAPLCESPAEVCYTNDDAVIALCLPGCDPVLQDCATSEACWPDGVDWVCLPDVSGRGPLPGTPCASVFDCGAGLVCIPGGLVADCAGEIGCCAAVCDVTARDPDAACAAVDPTATCATWYGDTEAPPGLGHVGVCVAGEGDTTGG